MTEPVKLSGIYDPCPVCWYPAMVLINGERKSPPGGITVSSDGRGTVLIMPHSEECADAYGSQVPEADRQIMRYAGRFLSSTYDYEGDKHGTVEPSNRALASILSVLPVPPRPDQYGEIRDCVYERLIAAAEAEGNEWLRATQERAGGDQ